jgi:hypothetical protein
MSIMNHGESKAYNPYREEDFQEVKSTSSRDLYNFEKEKARLEELSTDRRRPYKFRIPGERMKERVKQRKLRSQKTTPMQSKYSKGTNFTYTNSYNSAEKKRFGRLDSELDGCKITKTFNHDG